MWEDTKLQFGFGFDFLCVLRLLHIFTRICEICAMLPWEQNLLIVEICIGLMLVEIVLAMNPTRVFFQECLWHFALHVNCCRPEMELGKSNLT